MKQQRCPLIAGNWKMNGLSADALPLAGDLANRLGKTEGANFEMLVCPPFPYLDSVAAILRSSGVRLGAQDCHPNEKGAHTGDVSGAMLKDIGCDYVIVGHSERRADHGETDDLVKASTSIQQVMLECRKRRAEKRASKRYMICFAMWSRESRLKSTKNANRERCRKSKF